MTWTIILFIIGLVIFGLVVFGILFDLKRKNFRELKASSKPNASADNAFRDANTNNNVNSDSGGY